MAARLPSPRRQDPTPELGPAMRVLPPQWRRAVDALFDVDGDRSKALRLAGYQGKPESIHVMASRIFSEDRVRLAIKEECLRRIDASEPELISVVRRILHDSNEKAADRLRAASMLWDRANPVMTKHKIEVEHHLTEDERDVQHFHAMRKLGAPHDAFLARFGPNGIARVEALVAAEEATRKQIEGVEYAEIETKQPEAEASADFDEDMA